MEEYSKFCASDGCMRIVGEDDIERDKDGKIYERSKICFDCRTSQDKQAIKKWRQKHRVH